jgi:hypothetical protein
VSQALFQIQKLLPQLTKAEKKQLRALLTSFAGEETKPSTRAGWLLSGIIHELNRRGTSYGVRGVELDKMVGRLKPEHVKITDVESRLEHKLELALRRMPSPTELFSLGRVAAEALANTIERIPNRPVTMRTMLYSVPEMFEALDAAFPDYLNAGMLGMLV